MKIFTSKDISEIDRYTIAHEGVSSWELMERAASSIAKVIMERWLPKQRIVIFAGPGNNGGDALAVARLIADQGYSSEVFLFNTKSSLSPDCLKNRNMLKDSENVIFTEVKQSFDFPDLSETDVVVDGLFGNGLKERLVGGYVSIIKNINESGAFVISIDIPSGLFGETNYYTILSNVIHANLTLSIQFPRLSFFYKENAQCIGEWRTIDIGLSRTAMHNTPSNYYLIDSVAVKEALKSRPTFGDKNDFGRIYIAAGSLGMVGASVICTKAALRTGVGVVTTHTPSCGYLPMQIAVPEAIVDTDDDNCHITKIEPHPKASAVAIGPGIGTEKETINALGTFLKRAKKPVILDADALNCIAKVSMLISDIPMNSILTPNEAEFDRLFGDSFSEEERVKKAVDVAFKKKIIIILKGHYTKVIRPDGKVYINTSGNSGMATAGSGDALTGIIAALIGQGYSPCAAATIGVHIHGLAGDLAKKRHSEFGVIASDIVDNIGKAFKLILEMKSNYYE